MLHEILLSLSGVQSPIWAQGHAPGDLDAKTFNQYVSLPERAMLESLAHLQELHVQVKDATARFAKTHESMVCRAVSASIEDVHLGNFMDKVIQVETSVLKKDAAYVGAYGIVPLSTITSDFAPWTRRLEWLMAVVGRLNASSQQRRTTAPDILDFLEKETHTGYSDIEEMAVALLTVAQRAWMRIASLWILYGKLSRSGPHDFCVKENPLASSTIDTFLLDQSLVPRLVNSTAAQALYSTGTALNQLRSHGKPATSSLKTSSDPAMALLPRHLKLLESLEYPLNPPLLENVLLSINGSLSENALSQVLPRALVMRLLQVILRYVLLDHGEFAVSLVGHADDRVMKRQHTQITAQPVRKIGKLDDLAIKDAEINSILSKTMAELAALGVDDDVEEDVSLFAKQILSLRTVDVENDSHMLSTLLPTTTFLYITLQPSSPLHIFLSPQDTEVYALLNAYLLSIYRAGLHLSGLWKLSGHRRSYPTPLGPPRSTSQARQASFAARRLRDTQRMKRTRRHWTVASKALFLVNEVEAYLQGEVIQGSWVQLRRWLEGEDRIVSPKTSRPTTSSSAGQSRTTKFFDGPSGFGMSDIDVRPSDPRLLAEAHGIFLQALQSGLFFSNGSFVQVMKTLVTQCDHFVALFSRLQAVWEGLDLQEDDGVVDAFSNYAKDEREVLSEMDRTSDSIDAIVTELVNKIRDLAADMRTGIGADNFGQNPAGARWNVARFTPWQARTVDRLVMKLDSLAERPHDERDGLDDAEQYDDD
ncbi:gamma-tubulin complex component protein [Exophiala viscosa]|uniref:gamma-tubulin complex component protein n=1 Tax=Exophiala viscosa TaxID=2486360 RepID=UPI00219DFA49|nr:gamma-tubulin complex component protein [Exophiala viscosa]